MIAIKSDREINELIDGFKNNPSKKELGEYLKSKLNSEQSAKLDRILHDDRALKEILNTDKAKALIKKLTGDENGLNQ